MFLRVAISIFVGAMTFSAQAEVFKIAVFGDVPYIIPEGQRMFEKMIDDVNGERPTFSVHVGDIKGGGVCDRAYFKNTIDLFNRFKDPLIYTPGDNEWTDCHRATSGSGDPIKVLGLLREMFFGTNLSFGQTRLKLESQSQELSFAKYTENRRWVIKEIHFATVHVVGSNNNFQPEIKGAVAEFRARNAANIAWIDLVFRKAKAEGAKAVVLFSHADMNFKKYYKRQKKKKVKKSKSGFDLYIQALSKEVLDFKKPVFNVVGDTHSFTLDQPLRLPPDFHFPHSNYLRLIVFGFPEVRSNLVEIDTSKTEVFEMFKVTPQKRVAWEY